MSAKKISDLKFADGVRVVDAGPRVYRIDGEQVLEIQIAGIHYPRADGDFWVSQLLPGGLASISLTELYSRKSAALGVIADRIEAAARNARARTNEVMKMEGEGKA